MIYGAHMVSDAAVWVQRILFQKHCHSDTEGC